MRVGMKMDEILLFRRLRAAGIHPFAAGVDDCLEKIAWNRGWNVNERGSDERANAGCGGSIGNV